MKTVSIATFVMGMAAIFAAGCSAETGAPEAEGVGQTSEALHGTNPTSAAGNSMPVGSQFASSCVINDRGTDKLVVAGGFNASGTAIADIYVLTPGSTWATPKDVSNNTVALSQARGHLRGIALPGDVHSCAFVGGQSTLDSSGTTYATVEVLTVDANGKFSIATKGSLATARAKFALTTCNDKLMAVGGSKIVSSAENWASTGDIEVADASLASTWTSRASLDVAASDFGFVKDPDAVASSARYLLAGGVNNNGELSEIQVITTATDTAPNPDVTCGTVSVTRAALTSNHNADADLAQAIEGNKLFPNGVASSNKFVAAAGYSAASTPKLVLGTETLEVTDWANGYITKGTGISLTVGSHLAAFGGPITDGSNAKAFILAGGDTTPTYASNSSIAVTDAVQEYQTAQSLMKVALSAQRARAVAETIGGKVYVASGGSVASGTVTLNTAVEVITP